jgi:ATP-dependent RNA helicase RhlE
MLFSELGLAAPLLRALDAQGYTTPTPIQAQAIPPALLGRDLLGCAQTGTGKTAAFALPLLHRLWEARANLPPAPPPRAAREAPPRGRRGPHRPARPQDPFRPLQVLILAPTRELAVQIHESLEAYGAGSGLRFAAIFGGVGYQKQIDALKRGIDILVATPGRLLDLLEQGYGDLETIQAFVLDEADRMLDMGFMPDLRKIIARLPDQRQTLFFSATMPPEIAGLANDLLDDPVRIAIAPEKPAADRIEQTVCFVPRAQKSALLRQWLADHQVTRAIVFTRTKHGADRVARQLGTAGVKAEAIHGNKSQNARQRTLQAFRDNQVHVLVATDLAARGIDVDGISHVFNYDLPIEPETYIHRIGRTARAGASGVAVSFCDREERGMLKSIERLLKRALRVETNLPVVTPLAEPAEAEDDDRRERPRRPPQGGGGRARGPRPGPARGAASEGRPPRPAAARPSSGEAARAGELSSTGDRSAVGRPAGSAKSGRPKTGGPHGARPEGGRPAGARPQSGPPRDGRPAEARGPQPRSQGGRRPRRPGTGD